MQKKLLKKLLKILMLTLSSLILLPWLISGQVVTPSPTPVCPTCTMDVSGTVKNRAGGPVAGADVLLLSTLKDTTDALGNYQFTASAFANQTGCPIGDTYLYIKAAGYEQGARFIPVTCGKFTYDFTLVATPVPGLPGDVNGDNTVNIVDALYVARYVVGLVDSGFNAALADVNADGVITIIDALVIAQYAVGLFPILPHS